MIRCEIRRSEQGRRAEEVWFSLADRRHFKYRWGQWSVFEHIATNLAKAPWMTVTAWKNPKKRGDYGITSKVVTELLEAGAIPWPNRLLWITPLVIVASQTLPVKDLTDALQTGQPVEDFALACALGYRPITGDYLAISPMCVGSTPTLVVRGSTVLVQELLTDLSLEIRPPLSEGEQAIAQEAASMLEKRQKAFSRQ